MLELSLFNQLPHVTSRIEAVDAGGNASLGTGFFFNFNLANGHGLPVLVTNKHVIEGAASVTIYVSRADEHGNPIFGNYNRWSINDFSGLAVGHPNPDVDLAAFPVGPVLKEMERQGQTPFFRGFDVSSIPDQATASALEAVEDVMMIGYPTGIWDERNNIPIVRRGITATPYWFDYNGRAEFMIDAACFPGSSGSPVVIANNGSYSSKKGIVFGSRFYLLGLLWGGPQFTTEGSIAIRPVPTSSVPVARSSIPTNLGFCVKARMIQELEPLLVARFASK